jgi:GAF domain-containing protein
VVVIETVRGDDVADQFARLALELHAAPGLEETVDAVTAFALHAVDCTSAAVELTVLGGGVEVAAATSTMVEQILRFQIQTGDGPMLHAFSTATAVNIADPATETRWPLWCQFVRPLPVGSVLHVPLMGSGKPIGVLSLYRETVSPFSADDEAIAHILARHATIAVGAIRHELKLMQAVDARKVIGQAMGILMERYDLTSDQAFAALRRASQDSNRKLQIVAQEVIATRHAK